MAQMDIVLKQKHTQTYIRDLRLPKGEKKWERDGLGVWD